MSDRTESDHLRQSALNAGLREAGQKPIRQMIEEKDKEIYALKLNADGLLRQWKEADAEIARLQALLDEAMAVMGTYINVPEAAALRARWEKLKAPISQESNQSP